MDRSDELARCEIWLGLLGLSWRSPCIPALLSRYGYPSDRYALDGEQIAELADRLEDDWAEMSPEIKDARAHIARLFCELKVDWFHPVIRRWQERRGVKLASLTLDDLNDLITRLNRALAIAERSAS